MKSENYHHIYKTKHFQSGKMGFKGQINKDHKIYDTGLFLITKTLNKNGKWEENNPEREAALALDKLIIKHQLEIPLQILKPKQK